MKHLKTFENYELSDTEDPAISSAKVNMNNMSNWISEFNAQKSSLDTIYKTYRDQRDLRNKLLAKKLITKEGDGVSFLNPLLGIWAKISNKRRMIVNIEKSLELLTNTKNENNKKLIGDPDLKETIDVQNANIDANIKIKKDKIQEIAVEISDIEKESSEKLKEIQDRLKGDSKTLGN